MQPPESTANKILSTLFEVAEIMQNGVIWLNEDGHILGVNHLYATELGYDKSTFKPKTIFEVNPSTSFLSWKRLWKRLIEERQISFETEQITADKSIYPVQVRAALLEVDGHFLCMAVIENPKQSNHFKDQLEMTAKVAGVGTDELFFTKYCMDFAQNMIFWVRENGIISYANQQAYDTLGYRKEELVGQSSLMLTRETMGEQSWTELWEERKPQDTSEIEIELDFYTKNGKAIPICISMNIISFKGEKINCSFARNMSKVKRRDELIAMAKRSLDQSIDMIFWLNPDATFRYFNDAFLKKVGYTRKEIKNMSIIDFFPNIKISDFKSDWSKLQQGVILQDVDRELHLKGGKTVPTEMTVSLVKVNDSEYSSTMLRDISGRKRKHKELQNYIRQIEQLQQDAEAENIQLREEIKLESSFSNIISRDPNYKKVLRQVEQVADTGATVLILGETGTGKELLARSVHQLSGRSDYPMIKINCGALPENLIESEFFGHEKGAFTGAYQQKIGKFERADKGTIFLDEIGELPLDLQTKLLRVLQEGEIERVGGNKLIEVDVRVVAATNRNLEQQVAKGKFREDLYYRLNVFPIFNIPLRERREDIPVLVKYFAEKYSKKLNKHITEISPSELNKLRHYDFLGNVRELENLIERAVILAKSNVLTIDLATPNQKKAVSSKFKSMEEMQKNHIIDALRRTKGKVSGVDGAASLLDMNDKTLSSRMKKLNINKRDYLK